MATATPWGPSQTRRNITRGINFYTTASHGGYILSAGMNKRIPEYARNENRAYEEDCDWAIVETFLPQYFEAENVIKAKIVLMTWHPDLYERREGIVIPPGHSYIKDKRAEEASNRNKFVVVSACGSWHANVPTGKVGVMAVKQATGETGNFLVDANEYTNKPGFVVDEERHSPWSPTGDTI